MALDFPTSPSPNQVYTAGAKSWSWDNTSGAWLAVNAGIQGTQGTQGALGTQGAQGLQGITGANGSNGSQGIQGIQGTEGTAGFVGSNGAQGTQGIQGTQGTQGTQGIQGLKGTKITPGDTAPASPSENDLWWDSTNGILMVYYNDGTSAQWVTANSGIAGEQGIQGTQGTQGVQGIQGITGLAFTIAKTYLSVAALTADTSPTSIVAGQFALINTTNVEDAENSRLYIWTGSAYTFVDDLSGSAGIQGITGSQGVQGIQGIQGTQGTQGIQGVQGAQGTQGIQGISGASILGTANTFTNTNAFTSLTATGNISTSAGSISALAGELQVGSASKMIYLRTLSGSNRIDSYNNPITATVPLFINASTTSIGSDAITVVINSVGAAITGTLSTTGQITGQTNFSAGASGGDYPSSGYNFARTATSAVYNYNATDSSSRLEYYNGGFIFYSAPSGTGGNVNAITYTERARINTSGLAVTGALSATGILTVSGGSISGLSHSVQVFTTGSGTYTTPAGVKAIRVRLVGAGGGGGASAGTADGTAGGNTTFGSMTGNGGALGQAGRSFGGLGGLGGTSSGGDLNIAGSDGQSGGRDNGSPPGGGGGASFFGGAGRGGITGAVGTSDAEGKNAQGAGSGGGGAGGASGSLNSAGGGGSGGFSEKLIHAPSATYAYAIGAQGTGGAAGSWKGGNGAAGLIHVEEFYS